MARLSSPLSTSTESVMSSSNGLINASIDNYDYARSQDLKEELRHIREQFIIPSRADLKNDAPTEPGIYAPSLPEYK